MLALRPIRAHSAPFSLCFSCFLALFVGGCSGNDTDPAVPTDRNFVIGQIIISPEGFSSFAGFTSTLDESRTVEIADSVELPGLSGVVAGTRPGSFLVNSGLAPEVFRFDVDETGAITQAGPVSFAGRGAAITGNPPVIVPVEESKAYYLDVNQLLGFTFDPDTLTITGEFPLTGFETPSAEFPLGDFAGDPLRRGEFMYLTAAYRNLNDGTGAPLTRVLRINVTTDAFTVIDDDRCPLSTRLVEGPDGNIYTASDALHGAAVLARPDANAPSCVLRLVDDGTRFDPDFRVFFSELIGAEGAGSLIPGPDGEAYFLAYDESVAPPALTQNEIAGTPAWRTYRMTLGDMPVATRVDALPLRSTGGVSPGRVGSAYYDNIVSADFSETTLYRTDRSPTPERSITFRGLLGGIADLR
ncbi:MAG: hypothetical protein AAF500_04245 [Myxococcota bacterium]